MLQVVLEAPEAKICNMTIVGGGVSVPVIENSCGDITLEGVLWRRSVPFGNTDIPSHLHLVVLSSQRACRDFAQSSSPLPVHAHHSARTLPPKGGLTLIGTPPVHAPHSARTRILPAPPSVSHIPLCGPWLPLLVASLKP